MYKVKSYNPNNNDKKILSQLLQNPEGLRVKSISKSCLIKKITVYKRLEKLKENNLVENIYPIWKIVNGRVGFCKTLLHNDNIFELHGLGYILKLIKTPEWWNKRKPRLMRLRDWQFTNHNFGKNNSNPFQQLINENFVIQTYPESIIIISRKRYYSNNPYETIKDAIGDVVDLINYLEERFKFKFFPDGVPCLEIRKNDFNRLNDHLAKHCKKNGRRFLVELDKNRKVWVDYSEPFGKEANYPEGQEILEKVTKDFLINKPLTNSELQKLIQNIAVTYKSDLDKRNEYSKDILIHKEAIRKMGNNTEANTKSIELLADVIKDLRNEVIKLNGKKINKTKTL